MPKIIGAGLGFEATKSIKKLITYQKRPGGNAFYKHNKPGSINSYTPSWKQRDKRMLKNYVVACWQNKTSQEKQVFNNYVKDNGLSMTGWNYFNKLALKNPKKYLGIVGRWSMNNQVSGVISDLSGNGYNMSLLPTYPSNCPSLVPSRVDKLGECAQCAGTNQYLSAGNHADLKQVGSFSAIILVNISSCANSGSVIFGDISTDQKLGWAILLTSTFIPSFSIGFGTGFTTCSSTTVMLSNVWRAIGITYDKQKMKIFYRGVKQKEVDETHAVSASANSLYIARRAAWNYYIQGKYDEAVVFDRALPEGEMLSILNNLQVTP